MKFLIISALVAVAFAQTVKMQNHEDNLWELFKIRFNKQYENEKEDLKRKQIFLENLNFIQEHNKKYERGESTFSMAMNKAGDWAQHELTTRMKGYRIPSGFQRSRELFEVSDNINLPETVDWRKVGAVTQVKDQGTCGSCWAFSATGSIESHHFLKEKKLVSLSEQNLVDCSHSGEDHGCAGGVPEQAFQYVIENKGIDTEASYPYKEKDDKCHYDPKNIGTTVKSIVDIPSGNEEQLGIAVAMKGPVSVAIDASKASFAFYDQGVYQDTNCSSVDLDHAVLVVGYGKLGDKKYWLVKNSWGIDWGMNGYIMMLRDVNNVCGIATNATYPVV